MYHKHSINGAVIATLLLLLSMYNCKNQNDENNSTFLLSDIHTDTYNTYNLTGNYTQNFIFSPLKKNAIWVVIDGKRCEFDLTTHLQKPLYEVLGIEENADLGFIYVDPYVQQSFLFMDAKKQLNYYSKGMKTLILSPQKQRVTAVLFDKKSIWVGDDSGLWKFDRRSHKMDKMKSFNDALVSNIIKFNDISDSLLINYRYVFEPKTDQFNDRVTSNGSDNIYYSEKDGMHIYQNTNHVIRYTDRQNIIQTLPDGGCPFEGQMLCARHAILWTYTNRPDSMILNWYNCTDRTSCRLTAPFPQAFGYAESSYTNGDIILNKMRKGWVIGDRKSKSIQYFSQKLSGYARQIYTDSRNVYLLFDNKLMVMSIDWMISNAVPLENYNAETMDFKLRMDQLNAEADFYAREPIYDSIELKFGKTQNPFISDNVQQYKNQRYIIDFSDKRSVAFINQKIVDGKLDSMQQEQFYMNGAIYFARNADIERALQYAKKFKKLTGHNPEAISSKFLTFKFQRDSLRNLHLSEDAYTFAYGVILGNYYNGNTLLENQSIYQVSLAADQYKKVVRKYPESPWADNAAFALLMIDLYRFCDEGCFYNMENIKSLDRFVVKYPDSEMIPVVWLTAANVCLELYNENGETNASRKKLGLSYLAKVKKEYPEFTWTNDYKSLEDYYKNNLNGF